MFDLEGWEVGFGVVGCEILWGWGWEAGRMGNGKRKEKGGEGDEMEMKIEVGGEHCVVLGFGIKEKVKAQD